MSITVISQIIGYVACAVTIIYLQQKELIKMLYLAVLSNFLAGVSNIMLPGGLSGAGVCFVASVQTVFSLIYEKKGKKVPLWLSVVFIAGYIGIAACTYKTPLDILPCAGALLYAVAVMQKNPFVYRLCMVANALVWMYYVIRVKNYSLLLTFILQLASTVIAIVRIDMKNIPKKDARETE